MTRRSRIRALLLATVLAVAAVVAGMNLPAQADTLSRGSISDTFINQASSGTNYCNDTALALREGTTVKRAYLTFDTSIPQGATGASYTLRLYFNRVWSAGATVYPVAQESNCSLTWATAGGYDWQNPHGSTGAIAGPGYKDIPLNASRINQTGRSTFLVHANGTFGKRDPDLTFVSRDAASNQPQLLVTFTPAPTTTTTAPTTTTAAPTTTTAPPPPTPSGPSGSFRLTFEDNFDGTAVDTTKWTDKSSSRTHCLQGQRFQDGTYNNKQLEWNQMANASVANGLLTLTAKREIVTKSCTGSYTQTYNWTSAGLSSHYAFTYGVIEERSKQPPLAGFWPAFWTWQQPGANSWNEVDVYEYYSNNRNLMDHTTHLRGVNQGCRVDPPFDPSADFHTYTAEIAPTGVTYYVDGNKVCETPGLTPAEPMNILTNLAVFQDVPPASTTTVETKQSHYVRAWARV